MAVATFGCNFLQAGGRQMTTVDRFLPWNVACLPCISRSAVGRDWSLADLDGAQGDQGAEDGQDVKARGDLRFVQAFLHEVIVKRRHEEDASSRAISPSRVLEPPTLDQD